MARKSLKPRERERERDEKKGAKGSNGPREMDRPAGCSFADTKTVFNCSAMVERGGKWATKKICRGIAPRAVMGRFF